MPETIEDALVAHVNRGGRLAIQSNHEEKLGSVISGIHFSGIPTFHRMAIVREITRKEFEKERILFADEPPDTPLRMPHFPGAHYYEVTTD